MKAQGYAGALAILLALAGCSAGIGDACTRDSDCRAGLRCAVIQGKGGVCTYPDGVHDSAAQPDQRPAEAAAPDAALDATRDLVPADLTVDAATDRPLAEGHVDVPMDLASEGRVPDAATDLGADGP